MSSSAITMMPFIGVRISWLIVARNSDLARLAVSARVARLAQVARPVGDLLLEVAAMRFEALVALADVTAACD